jgi:hypothetical protein
MPRPSSRLDSRLGAKKSPATVTSKQSAGVTGAGGLHQARQPRELVQHVDVVHGHHAQAAHSGCGLVGHHALGA